MDQESRRHAISALILSRKRTKDICDALKCSMSTVADVRKRMEDGRGMKKTSHISKRSVQVIASTSVTHYISNTNGTYQIGRIVHWRWWRKLRRKLVMSCHRSCSPGRGRSSTKSLAKYFCFASSLLLSVSLVREQLRQDREKRRAEPKKMNWPNAQRCPDVRSI